MPVTLSSNIAVYQPPKDPFVAWPESDSAPLNLPPSPLETSISNYVWAQPLIAAASRVLEAAGIPHCLWGDLLNQWRGNPHLPAFCGFVVPSADLTLARVAISRAGLPPCNCQSFLHSSEPCLPGSSRIHFPVKGTPVPACELFLVGDAELLYLIPLIPSHPNPAFLEFEDIALSLGHPSVDGNDDRQIVRALTRSSLIKIYLLGLALSSLVGKQGGTAGYYYHHLLAIMITAEYPNDSKELGVTTEGVRKFWDEMCRKDVDRKVFRNEQLRYAIRLEWDGWLRERFPDTYMAIGSHSD